MLVNTLDANEQTGPVVGCEIAPNDGLELKPDGLQRPGRGGRAHDARVSLRDSREGGNDSSDGDRLAGAEDLDNARSRGEPVETAEEMRRTV